MELYNHKVVILVSLAQKLFLQERQTANKYFYNLPKGWVAVLVEMCEETLCGLCGWLCRNFNGMEIALKLHIDAIQEQFDDLSGWDSIQAERCLGYGISPTKQPGSRLNSRVVQCSPPPTSHPPFICASRGIKSLHQSL